MSNMDASVRGEDDSPLEASLPVDNQVGGVEASGEPEKAPLNNGSKEDVSDAGSVPKEDSTVNAPRARSNSHASHAPSGGNDVDSSSVHSNSSNETPPEEIKAKKKMHEYFDLSDEQLKEPVDLEALEQAYAEDPTLFETGVDEHGRSAMHLAVLKKDRVALKWLAEEAHVHVGAVDMHKQSVMHYAAYCGGVLMLLYLKEECNAPIESRDKTGRTILHHAALGNQYNVLKLLISKFKMDIDTRDSFGATALHWAAAKGKWNSMKYLVKMGANVHIEVGPAVFPTPWPLPDHEYPELKSLNPAEIARKHEHRRIANFLNEYYKLGKSFLRLCACLDREGKYHATTVAEVDEAIQKFEQWSQNPEYQCETDPRKESSKKHFTTAKLSIKYFRDEAGRTGLHRAAEQGTFDVMQYLVEERKFLITSEDFLKRLPLHYAALHGQTKKATWLMCKKASAGEKFVRYRYDVKDDSEDFQVMLHWEKKTRSGATATVLAREGYKSGLHDQEHLDKELESLASQMSNGGGTIVEPSSALRDTAEADTKPGAKEVLEELRLDKDYLQGFIDDGYDTFESLRNLTEEDLVEMKVKKGHIKQIMNKLKEDHCVPLERPPSRPHSTERANSSPVPSFQNDGKTSADAVHANPVIRTPRANAKKPLQRSQSTPIATRPTQLHTENAKPADIGVHAHAQSMVFEHTDHAGGKCFREHAETVNGVAPVGNELSVEKTLAPVIEVPHDHSAKVESAESAVSNSGIESVDCSLAAEDMLAPPSEESLISSNLQVMPADNLLEPPVATETTPNDPSTIDPVNSALAAEDMLAPPSEESLISSNLQVMPADNLLEPPVAT